MIERVKLLLSVKNLSSAQLAEMIGVQRSGISHILSGRNKASLDFVLKVLDAFPELNEIWLLKGEGEMLKTAPAQHDIFDERTDIPAHSNIEMPVNQVQEPSMVRSEDPPPYGNNISESDKRDDIAHQGKTSSIQSEIAVNIDSSEKTMHKKELDDSTKRLVKLIAIYSDDSFKIYHQE